jgi:hypothetical protein
MKAHRLKNRDKVLEYHKNYYIENKDKSSEYYKEYYINHRESSTEYLVKLKLNGCKKADIKKNREFDLDYESAKQIYNSARGICCYCKKICKPNNFEPYDPDQFTFDRINNDIGHTKSNCVISCLHCNLNKKTQNHYDYMIDVELYGN